jgi:hypothetical protein
MAITKTEQGRLDRVAEREARAAATQARRDKTAEAQARSEQKKEPNPSSAKSTMDQREAAAGLNLAGKRYNVGPSRWNLYSYNGSKRVSRWFDRDNCGSGR